MTRIRRATEADCPALTELAIRSKAVWGYDRHFLEVTREDMEITPARLAEEQVVGAFGEGGEAVGVAALGATEAPDCGEVTLMFVAPRQIGSGLGRRLMEEMTALALEAGYAELILDADPNAVGFYAHMGFRYLRDIPSSYIPGRVLPRMAKRLEEPATGG